MFQPIKPLDIDLSEPLTDLNGLERYRAVRLLIRLRGTPLGGVELPTKHGRVAASDIQRAVFDQLNWPLMRQHLLALLAGPPAAEWNVEAVAAAPPAPTYSGPWPSLSVAVCTRDRPDDLACCIEALLALDYPGELELLIIDNAPSDDRSERLVRERFPQVRYLHEARPGLNWARNLAIQAAHGELLAYTDDDVIVDRLWARAIAQVFAENPGVMGLTGLVVPSELETPAQVDFERYGGFGRGYIQRWFAANLAGGERAATNYLGTGKFGTGANMAYRRSVFARIGAFDPVLGVGTGTTGGSDLDMFFRVIKGGFAMVYEPRALVRHRHRRDTQRLRTQLAANGTGLYAYFVRNFVHFPDERWAIVRYGLWWWLYWCVLHLVWSFTRPGTVNRSRRMIWAELTGALVGLGRYHPARRAIAALTRPDDLPDTISHPAQREHGLRAHGAAVRRVDLARPLQPLLDVSAYPETHLIVERDGVQIGAFSLPNRYQPIQSERLREAIVDELGLGLLGAVEPADVQALTTALVVALRARYTPAPLAPRPNPELAVSVIVSSHNRPSELRRCLHDLLNQRTIHPLEVIVAEGRLATSQTVAVVAEFPGVRLLDAPSAGAAQGRGAGLRAARGAIVVLVDDAVRLPANWLEQLVAPFAAPEVVAVAGNLLPLELEHRSQRIFELRGGLGHGFARREFDRNWLAQQRGAVPVGQLGSAANLALRATSLADQGASLLEQGLGPDAPADTGAADYLLYKLLQAGGVVVYEPRAYAWHRHRQTMDGLRELSYRASVGHIAQQLTALAEHGDRRARGELLQLPLRHARQLLRHALTSFRGRSQFPLGLLLAEIVGSLIGPFALLRRARASRNGAHIATTSSAVAPPACETNASPKHNQQIASPPR